MEQTKRLEYFADWVPGKRPVPTKLKNIFTQSDTSSWCLHTRSSRHLNQEDRSIDFLFISVSSPSEFPFPKIYLSLSLLQVPSIFTSLCSRRLMVGWWPKEKISPSQCRRLEPQSAQHLFYISRKIFTHTKFVRFVRIIPLFCKQFIPIKCSLTPISYRGHVTDILYPPKK